MATEQTVKQTDDKLETGDRATGTKRPRASESLSLETGALINLGDMSTEQVASESIPKPAKMANVNSDSDLRGLLLKFMEDYNKDMAQMRSMNRLETDLGSVKKTVLKLPCHKIISLSAWTEQW